LIYDWNALPETQFAPKQRVMLDDESLRDGLQSPSVKDPHIEEKIKILHLMEDLGIDLVDIGLPGAGPRAVGGRRAAGAGNRELPDEDQAQLRRPYS